MKIQSSELSGRVLDWAAAKAAGHNVDGIAAQMASHIENWESREVTPIPKQHIRPYCEWFWAGCYLGPQGQRLAIPEFHRNANLVEPFVEELGIATHPDYVSIKEHRWHSSLHRAHDAQSPYVSSGATPREAALRCFVLFQLGPHVEVPDEVVRGLKAADPNKATAGQESPDEQASRAESCEPAVESAANQDIRPTSR